nr:immunoglobulin heavy chain junction region [Mus musculus]
HISVQDLLGITAS